MILFIACYINGNSQNLNWLNIIDSTYASNTHQKIYYDSFGNIYMAGSFHGTVDFDASPAVYNLTTPTIVDAIFIAKYTGTGSFIWAKMFTGVSNNNELWDLVIDNSGNVYSTGGFTTGTDFDPGPGTYTLAAGAGSNKNIYVSKLDLNGNFIWAKNMPGVAVANGFAVAVDLSNNVYVSGFYNGTVDFDPGAGVYNLGTSAASCNGFVCKLNSAGNFVWAKSIGGSTSYVHTYDMKLDLAGFIFLTGDFTATTDMDPGVAVFNLTPSSSMDTYISKLDFNGNFIWAKRFGGSSGSNTIPIAMAVDGNLNIAIIGQFDASVVDFDPSASTFTLANNGLSQIPH